MHVQEKGHVYALANRVPAGVEPQGQLLTFVNKEPGREHAGTTTQEVLRALIDRTRHCNNCLPHPNNERVIYHLRMALVLHEARALERKTEKGDIAPEFVGVGDDGHFDLVDGNSTAMGEITPLLTPYRHDWDRECKHPPAPERSQAGGYHGQVGRAAPKIIARS